MAATTTPDMAVTIVAASAMSLPLPVSAGPSRSASRETSKVEAFLKGLPGITDIHDLHIWSMSTTETALTVNLVRSGAGIDDDLLADAADALKHRFNVHHATFQVESGSRECALAPAPVV